MMDATTGQPFPTSSVPSSSQRDCYCLGQSRISEKRRVRGGAFEAGGALGLLGSSERFATSYGDRPQRGSVTEAGVLEGGVGRQLSVSTLLNGEGSRGEEGAAAAGGYALVGPFTGFQSAQPPAEASVATVPPLRSQVQGVAEEGRMESTVAPAAGPHVDITKPGGPTSKRSDSTGSLAATEVEEDSAQLSDSYGLQVSSPPAEMDSADTPNLAQQPLEPSSEELPTVRDELTMGESGGQPHRNSGPPRGPTSSDDHEGLYLRPPDEGTPAAEALAANAMIPALRSKGLRSKKPKFSKLTRNLKRKSKLRNFQGNVIKGEHEQYTLTIGMMLGIRVAVGRPQQMDDLTLVDFMQVDKYVFPSKGCNKPPHRTPPHHLAHEFKFKDYAPKIFHRIRQLFGIDSASYMLSVCGNYNYLEFMSNSKSGQFFFYSHDGRFMIKTQTPEENKFLRKILPHYYQYVSLNPDTLLTRFYGMHRVKMRHLKRKMHFVIMHSVFDTKERIYRIYDLKGSTVGRSSGPGTVRKEGVVYKDLDLVDDKVVFHLGSKRRLFMEQLEKDATFLASLNIMDYSLLVGIHDRNRREDSVERGPSFRLDLSGSHARRESTDSQHTSPQPSRGGVDSEGSGSITGGGGRRPPSPRIITDAEVPRTRREYSHESSLPEEGHSVELSTDLGEVDDEDDSDYDSDGSDSDDDLPAPPSMVHGMTSQSLSQLSDKIAAGLGQATEATILSSAIHHQRLTHRKDHGVQSRLPDNTKGPEIYYIGIIDILQQYNAFKRAETFFKSFKYDRRQISAVDPKWYAVRFVNFMRDHTN